MFTTIIIAGLSIRTDLETMQCYDYSGATSGFTCAWTVGSVQPCVAQGLPPLS